MNKDKEREEKDPEGLIFEFLIDLLFFLKNNIQINTFEEYLDLVCQPCVDSMVGGEKAPFAYGVIMSYKIYNEEIRVFFADLERKK